MLASLAYGKLAPDLRDLDEAQLAIDALRALLPLIPEEHRRFLDKLLEEYGVLQDKIEAVGGWEIDLARRDEVPDGVTGRHRVRAFLQKG